MSPPPCSELSNEASCPFQDLIYDKHLPLPSWKTQLLISLGLESFEDKGISSEIDTPKYEPLVFFQKAGGDGSASKSQDVVQFCDPRLLAAVRVIMLEENGYYDQSIVSSMPIEQLGGWKNPLGQQHEVEVLTALAKLCAALYMVWLLKILRSELTCRPDFKPSLI